MIALVDPDTSAWRQRFHQAGVGKAFSAERSRPWLGLRVDVMVQRCRLQRDVVVPVLLRRVDGRELDAFGAEGSRAGG